MFLQFSPVNCFTKQQQTSDDDTAVLKLVPFTKIPKIIFENTFIGETSVKQLLIQNPDTSKTKLTITKLPSANRFLSLNWNEAEIEAQGEVILELSWTPKEEGKWRETLSLIDGRNFKRDVPLLLSSVRKKGKKKVIQKQSGKPGVVAAPSIKKFCPPKYKKKHFSTKRVEKHITPQSFLSHMESDKENSPAIFQKFSSNLSPKMSKQNTENLSFSKLSFSEKLNRIDDFSSPTNINFKCENIQQTQIRRETYAINKSTLNNLIKSPENFNDSLELERKFNNIISPDVKSVQSSCDSFIKKLNMDSPEVFVSKNINSRSDDYLVQKLLADSFNYMERNTPKSIPQIYVDTEFASNNFKPVNCSTEMKVRDKIYKNNSSSSKELFKLNNTYEISPKLVNNSGDTSMSNLNENTYTINNLSSSSTYDLLSPRDSNFKTKNLKTSSPVSQISNQNQHTPNYLNFSGINAKTALSCITEEQSSSISRNFNNRSSLSSTGTKRRSDIVFSVSPPKRLFIKPNTPKSVKNNNLTWNKKLVKTERIRRKSISYIKLNLTNGSSKSKSDTSASSSINLSSQTTCSIDPFLIAAAHSSDAVLTNLDPFVSSTLYYDETWLDKQITELKKWLNTLLTPPTDLDAKIESRNIDVAKLWQDCIKKDLVYAPSKENISSKYHTSDRLETLRKSAKKLFLSFEIRNVFTKVVTIIENKQLSLREDKKLHLDVGLQSNILNLLLCYNPLWLRIGLETIYNENIQLESNSDVMGLSTFIMLRFFQCPDLIPKNKKLTHAKYVPSYETAIKKFTLKKFLLLVYFLDQAKTKKLISHDPCLFCKDAPIKESREVLLYFSRELVSAIGDITKFLRRLGYEVMHKQNHIDEFDYAVKNLGVDLRDGVRLTKVMEIILLRNDLTTQLRSPAVSRLQKVHNVKLAFESLAEAGFKIAGEITPRDIVDGHREKTLSFLWQIIYKFQAPRFVLASTKIQNWWKSLRIVIRRRILDRPRQRRIKAALQIQQFYRSWKMMQWQRSQFLLMKKSVLILQHYFKSIIVMKRDRNQYLMTKRIVVKIQQQFKANKLMKKERNNFLQLRNAVIVIQRRFRAILYMKHCRKYYLTLKEIVIRLQRNFRSKKLLQNDRNIFLAKRNAAIVIQKYFRAKLLMKIERNNYLHTKEIIIKLQQRFRATILMRKARLIYLQKRNSVILLQQWYRTNKLTKNIHQDYLKLKKSAVLIQQLFRAKKLMKIDRENYLHYRKIIIKVQQIFRAKQTMKIDHQNYLQQKQAIVIIQRYFRAYLAKKRCRKQYMELKKSVILIEHRFAAQIAMKKCRKDYLELKSKTIFIQRIFKANLLMKIERENYLKMKKSAIIIQQRFRANIAMKIEKEKYLQIRQTVIFLQRCFKRNITLKKQRELNMKRSQAAVVIQQHWRSYVTGKLEKESYNLLRKNVIVIQNRFRANLVMKQNRKIYVEKKLAAIKIQRWFRNIIVNKKYRKYYLLQKKSACIIQKRFREYLLMKNQRKTFLQMKKSAIVIQNSYRSYLLLKKCRQYYIHNKEVMKKQTIEAWKMYRLEKAASLIQASWRGYKTRKEMSKKLMLIRQRSLDAAKNAHPDLRVGQKNREAIQVLMYQTSMKEILRALTVLDFTTRLFPNLCVEVCDDITDRLYVLLDCANRSVPDMDINILCISVLINLFKYKPTTAAVWKTEYIERLLSLLLHWSNQSGDLFIYLCTLLWLFAQNPEYCKVIKDTKNAVKILSKTFQFCERRQKMLKNMRNPQTTIQTKKDVHPTLKPDWGICNKNKPRLFQNPFFGVKCLLKKLNISL